jgi:uncharacterized cupin superfamily protein
MTLSTQEEVMQKPDCIRHWRELEGKDDSTYPDSPELFSIGAPLARSFGLSRLGIHHERIPPGRRTSYPHAESSEEEFAYVLEGHPEVWINGHLWQLEPGDSVGFPAGTGICHTFINNTEQDVRLLVVGEANKAENKIYYPLNQSYAMQRKDRWIDHPPQFFGPHNGLPSRKPKGKL